MSDRSQGCLRKRIANYFTGWPSKNFASSAWTRMTQMAAPPNTTHRAFALPRLWAARQVPINHGLSLLSLWVKIFFMVFSPLAIGLWAIRKGMVKNAVQPKSGFPYTGPSLGVDERRASKGESPLAPGLQTEQLILSAHVGRWLHSAPPVPWRTPLLPERGLTKQRANRTG
jgi:hypothetical protein